MKTNLLLLSGTALLIAASGCLQEEPEAEAPNVPDPRAALIKALDKQATELISGINQVIITGNFVKNMAVQNPPKPIPLGNDSDVQKAIGYLLSGQSTSGPITTYKPDSRFCTELVAKNDPGACVQFIDEITFSQTPSDATSGSVEVRVGQAKPFVLLYGPDSVTLHAQAAEVVKALQRMSFAQVQNGEAGFENQIPTVYEGAIMLSISSGLASSVINLSVTQALDIEGKDSDNRSYALKVAAAQSAVMISLNSAIGTASVVLGLPAATANLVARDDQNTDHDVEIQFPGLSGSLNLFNDLEKVAIEALQLAAADMYIEVDGQNAVHASSNSQINAELQSAAGGNLTVTVLQAIAAQVSFSSNPLIPKLGEISVAIAEDTQVYFAYGSEQAKVLQGSFQLLGSQDFAGSLNAGANSCFVGDQNQALFLTAAICE